MNEWMLHLFVFYKLDFVEFIKSLKFLTGDISQDTIAG